MTGLPPEKQVCSLDFSQKLKELGVPQQSLFWWSMGKPKGWEAHWKVVYVGPMSKSVSTSEIWVSAFTAAELLDLIPDKAQVVRYGYKGIYLRWGVVWIQDPLNERSRYHSVKSETLEDALAKMLVYIIEKGLVSVKDLTTLGK